MTHSDYIKDVETVCILTGRPESKFDHDDWDEVCFQHRLRQVIQSGDYDPEQDEDFHRKPQVVQDRYIELKRLASLKG